MAESIPPLSAAPYAAVTPVFVEAGLLVAIRHERKRLDDLPDVFDASFRALADAARSGWVIPTGPAFAVYYGDPQGAFDLEIGFPAFSAPTADIPTAAGTIHASALPSGPAAVLSHIGAYDGLAASWAALAAGSAGAPRGIWIEAYVADPSTTAEAELRTDLILPLAQS